MSYNDAVAAVAGPSSQTITATEARFVHQFRRYGGTLSSKCKFAHYETMGTGLIAAETIKEGEAIFSIPRHMLLNLKNSILPELCMQDEEKLDSGRDKMRWQHVNTGWLGLILTMMWEQFRSSDVGRKSLHSISRDSERMDTSMEMNDAMLGKDSREDVLEKGKQDWGFYLDILPKKFDTPMFWSLDDLSDLKGTSIPSKIGKEEASRDYVEKIRPYIISKSQIFFGSLLQEAPINTIIEEYYSIDCFHMMGSRILSRSFHVKDAREGILGEEGREYDERETHSDVELDLEEEGEEEEDEDINTVSMVPMADMLNARNGCDNAHLFYLPNRLEMRATQVIPAGSQIMNTYGDPPSSDLLRRYGYVDLGNAADVVEIGVEELLQACLNLEQCIDGKVRRMELLDRVAWSCSLGLDEVFALTYPFPPSDQAPYRAVPSEPTSKELKEAAMNLSDELLIQARVLCLSQEAFVKVKGKEKLPNPKVDAVEDHKVGQKDILGVAELIIEAIDIKMKAYSTSVKEDEEVLYSEESKNWLTTNKRNAVVVRLSEKRILVDTQKVLRAAQTHGEFKRKNSVKQDGGHTNKRKRV